eukprot:1181193-Prorocentrum_minimum.AAC.2
MGGWSGAQRCPVLGLKFVRTMARAGLYHIDFMTSQSGGVETVRYFEGDPTEHRHLLREERLTWTGRGRKSRPRHVIRERLLSAPCAILFLPRNIKAVIIAAATTEIATVLSWVEGVGGGTQPPERAGHEHDGGGHRGARQGDGAHPLPGGGPLVEEKAALRPRVLRSRGGWAKP